jgi:hypothetical protein
MRHDAQDVSHGYGLLPSFLFAKKAKKIPILFHGEICTEGSSKCFCYWHFTISTGSTALLQCDVEPFPTAHFGTLFGFNSSFEDAEESPTSEDKGIKEG